jgi:hypothetical protein
MDYEKLRSILTEELSEFITKSSHISNYAPEGVMLSWIIKSFNNSNISFTQIVEEVGGILDLPPYMFTHVINSIFQVEHKPMIDIFIDDDKVLSNQTNIAGAFREVILEYLGGIEFIRKMNNERWNPHIIHKNKLKEYMKQFKASVTLIEDPNSEYVIVQPRVLASTASIEMKLKYGENAVAQAMTSMVLINEYLGLEKIKINCKFKIQSKILKNSYKL